MSSYTLIRVTEENLESRGLYCIRTKSNPGLIAKKEWIKARFPEGMLFQLLLDDSGTQAGFIEAMPGKYAWRPVIADNSMVIHCILVIQKVARNKGYAKALLQSVIDHAEQKGMDGVTVMTSSGPWIADKRIFMKHGFQIVEEKDRFELLHYPLKESPPPRFHDWTEYSQPSKSWSLVYANQCPMLNRCLEDIPREAEAAGIQMKKQELESREELLSTPSGYAVCSLFDGKHLISDHYVSRTRFKSILKKSGAGR